MPFCGVGGKTVQRKLVLLGDGACGTDDNLGGIAALILIHLQARQVC